jgi:hypothetical protein
MPGGVNTRRKPPVGEQVAAAVDELPRGEVPEPLGHIVQLHLRGSLVDRPYQHHTDEIISAQHQVGRPVRAAFPMKPGVVPGDIRRMRTQHVAEEVIVRTDLDHLVPPLVANM